MRHTILVRFNVLFVVYILLYILYFIFKYNLLGISIWLISTMKYALSHYIWKIIFLFLIVTF